MCGSAVDKEFVNKTMPECSSELLWVLIVSDSSLSPNDGEEIHPVYVHSKYHNFLRPLR